jgi:hypothetical protein
MYSSLVGIKERVEKMGHLYLLLFHLGKNRTREERFKYDRYIGDMFGKANGLQRREGSIYSNGFVDICVMSCKKGT